MDEPKISLPRKHSGIYSQQGYQATCYAHAASKIFSRIVKVIFSPFFVKEDESCDWLYDTDFLYKTNIYKRNGDLSVYPGIDIDKYLIEKNGKSIFEICNYEILSNLLFLFFYNKTTREFGLDRGQSCRSLILFIEAMEIYGSINNELGYTRVVEDIIETIGLDINRVKGDQKKFLESCFNLLAILLISMGKLMIKDINLTYHYLEPSLKPDENSNLKSFLDVLKDGYYAILRIKGRVDHAITVIDYIKDDVSEKIDLIVKNSWGKEDRGYGPINVRTGKREEKINPTGIIEDFKFNEYYGYICFIHPSFKKGITRDYINNFVREQILLLNPALLLELTLNPIDPQIEPPIKPSIEPSIDPQIEPPIDPQIENVESIPATPEPILPNPIPQSNPRPRNTLRSLRKTVARITGLHNFFGRGGKTHKRKNIKTKRKKR